MNADAMRALGAAGIALRRHQPGNHRAPCPQCDRGPRDDALGVTVEPDGSWVGHCFRCDWRAAWRPREVMPERPAARQAVKLEVPRRPLDPFVWNRCRAVTPDCPVGRYLIGRGCALPAPHAVRWRPDGAAGYPEMVALITDIVSNVPVSLHFTAIAHDGSGKAPIDRPRRYLAGHRKAGAVVRLSEDAEVTTGLCIGEGLETALTAARGIAPIWSTLDAGNLAGFPVLPGIEALTVLVDHDEAGIKAAESGRVRWEAAGREVTFIKSPVLGEDFNDLARGVA